MSPTRLQADNDFDPSETPTGTYKAGKIRDRNLSNIVAAAAEEFVQHGYKGTSIQAIANRGGVPKANIHYYFKSKSNLYVAVLDDLVRLWNDFLNSMSEDDDPAEVLDLFIRKKVEMSYSHPRASKLFAMEIIQGAPHLKEYLRTDMRQWVRDKTRVINAWIEQGKMSKVDPVHLIFLIWSSTQHYADFDVQVLTIMNCGEYEQEMIDEIADFLSGVILRGCGLEPPRQVSGGQQ
ncbi:TetR/AcrR family transcriptional regulator [Echinimonas agarilytica]|uniref:TetR/AcrR family transcriptional regulator n=1 Tax=Echinimonas agarilytica TaxID=1215918 RepID=A0AA41W783_9GAMM|nr:TetR/AcrR family transcriptional regulator [Echinimonas agarilytica]MCM2680209.1 TetR/AcrR family transcriptional regulator [Echinimonas agarilytica]